MENSGNSAILFSLVNRVIVAVNILINLWLLVFRAAGEHEFERVLFR